MELTAETFRRLEDSFDYRQQLALRTALGDGRLGLLPGADFNCRGVFVRNTFEIEKFRCLSILPSGRIIDADQEVAVNIPMLYGEEYYLGVSVSPEERHLFEREGVACSSPCYAFAIYSLEDLKKKDIFPVAKFLAKDGILSVSEDYIVPCLFLSENQRFSSIKADILNKLESISSHPNFEEGDGKRSFLRYIFILKSLGQNIALKDFILLIQEIIQAAGYFIITPNSNQSLEIPLPDYYDIEKWLTQALSYLDLAKSVLDKVVLEDNTIDYNALLEQAKKELYERLRPELLETLPSQIKKEVFDDMANKLKEFLPGYLQEKLDEIKKLIGNELAALLEPKLFDDLFKRLYDALYVAPEEEDEFMPMI